MSRINLATIVEQQKQQISHYETKLRDVVRAYKALQKERDALQTGIAALNAATGDNVPPTSDAEKVKSADRSTKILPDDHNIPLSINESSNANDPDGVETQPSPTSEGKYQQAELSSSEKQTEGDSSKAEAEDTPRCQNTQLVNRETVLESSHSDQIKNMQKKLQSLTLALTDMSTEKELLKQSFMQERKRMAEEKEKVVSERERAVEEARTASSTAEEMRQRLQQLQRDRAADADDAAIRLRECQRVVSEHREARERLELQLQQVQHKLLQRSVQQRQQQVADSQHQQQQKQLAELKNVICQLEARVTAAEKEGRQKEAELQQVRHLHASSATALHQESTRAQEAEAELCRAVAAARDREAALEARLAETATCMASSTALDTASAATVLHYKARVRELSEQNQELQSKLNLHSDAKSSNGDPSGRVGGGQEAEYLVKQVKKLWLQLQLMPLSTALRCDLESMLGGSDMLHESCRQQQNSLMQQLLQLQSTIHSSSSGGGLAAAASKREQDVSVAVRNLREELRNATAAAQVTEAAHISQIHQLKQECRSIRSECEERLVSAQQSHRAVLCSLEQQLTSQRLHSLATLQERDVELNRLQQQLHSLSAESAQAPSALVSSTAAAARAGPLLHHIQELQRREQEVAALQQEKRQLQQAVREVQQTALDKRLQHEDRLAALEMQLERYDRNQSRESQNLEYLKNVLLHFLTTSPDTGALTQKAMVKAVAAVLKLTPKEEERLKRGSKGGEGWWWWGGGQENK